MQQTGPRGESSGSIAAVFQAPPWPADDAQFHRALPANDEPHGSDRRGLGLRDQARRVVVDLLAGGRPRACIV